MTSPTRHAIPFAHASMASAITPRGGTSARSASFAGPFYSPCKGLHRVPCGIRLSRDARSGSCTGTGDITANRAARTGRRGDHATQRRPRRLSFLLGEAAHEFRAHHADRHQAGWPPCPARKAGAPAFVMRSPARPPLRSQIDDLTHGDGSSFGFSSRNQKPNRSAFHDAYSRAPDEVKGLRMGYLRLRAAGNRAWRESRT